MESLSAQTWDAVIAGTSLPQSLLALALSKCDLQVLHVDRNDYYGGLDAGLSLDEAEKWINSRQGYDKSAQILTPGAVGRSRNYTISLKPQIIYAKSRFLPTLVSSQIHSQLEFQAVGSFWIYKSSTLQKIPSNREDVFADDTLSVRDKRKLMGLLRYVLEEQEDATSNATLEEKLLGQFKLPADLLAPVQALTLSTNTPSNVSFDSAMSRLKLHLSSMGYFGPGLAAVMAKYGGNAEIAQVACRAGAVGGFVYLLGQGVKAVQAGNDDLLSVELSDGTVVKSKWIIGTADDVPQTKSSTSEIDSGTQEVLHKINIVSNPLRHLFIPASDSSPVPAIAVVLVDNGTDRSPIYLQVHSEDTGECPKDQCIVYASCVRDDDSTQQRLVDAVDSLISASSGDSMAQILWSMSFTTREVSTGSALNPATPPKQPQPSRCIIFPQRTHDIAFDDSILGSVRTAWDAILGDRSSEYDFLRFEERRDENDDHE